MQGGRWIAMIGAVVVLCGGCASRPAGPGPMAIAAPSSLTVGQLDPAPLDMDPTASVPQNTGRRIIRSRQQDVADEATDFIGGDLAGDDAGVRPPRPREISAVRGGSIMVESPAEQAASKRQLAAMQRDVDPPRVDFGITTGSTPAAAKQ